MKNKFKIGDKVKFICTKNEVSNSLTIGKIYEVLGVEYDGSPRIKNDRGNVSTYMHYRFEEVDDLFDDIEKARNLVGKMIMCSKSGTIFSPTAYGVGNQYTDHIYLSEGNAVYLEDDDTIVLLSECEEVSNVVKLNDEYHATIEGNIVKVGCQSIPIDKVKQILSIWENLN